MTNNWKIGFFGLLALIIIGANVFVWYQFFYKPGLPLPSPTASPAISVPSPTSAIDESNLIKQAIFKLTGLDETKAGININKKTDKHATGNIKEFAAVGGAYWLAAKSGAAGWVGVYAGQAQPKCSEIAPYDFPLAWVPDCLDASGQVVSR